MRWNKLKICVRYLEGRGEPSYLASRLRKNLKGALESQGEQLVDSLDASPSIVHLISPEDDSFALKAKEAGAKVVVSALYTEEDLPASYLLEKEEDGYQSLKNKAVHLLKSADFIFVPSARAKGILIDSGQNADKIEILSPGVNVSRFEGLDQLEKDVFRQYFNIRENEKTAIIFANCRDNKELKLISSFANEAREYRFLVISYEKRRLFSLRKRLVKKGPGNISYEGVWPDDVYRSALKDASFLLFLGEPNPIAALEAMASKTPIFVYGNLPAGSYLRKGNDCFVFEEEKSLIEAMHGRASKGYDSYIERAYRRAREESLLHLGKKVVTRYEKILERE